MNSIRFGKSLTYFFTFLMVFTLQTTVCSADDTGWFAGLGLSALDADFEDQDDLSYSDSDTAIHAKAGYMFNDNFGIEGGYMDLGDYDGDGGVRVDADGYWLAGIGNVKIARNWDLYGKLGAVAIDATSDQVIPGVGRVSENDTETNVFGAVGIEWDLGQWGIYGEYSVMDTDISNLDIAIIAVGVKYEFEQ